MKFSARRCQRGFTHVDQVRFFQELQPDGRWRTRQHSNYLTSALVNLLQNPRRERSRLPKCEGRGANSKRGATSCSPFRQMYSDSHSFMNINPSGALLVANPTTQPKSEVCNSLLSSDTFALLNDHPTGSSISRCHIQLSASQAILVVRPYPVVALNKADKVFEDPHRTTSPII